MRTLVKHAVGGGWGSDASSGSTEEVAVIRGADFPAVAVGDTSRVPVRWEEARKIPQRTLEAGDIVLEISGGTSDRPTGRTVFVSRRLLESLGRRAIPASFCRLLRVDDTLADPEYVYWWLQGMYAAGRTWSYQNRSTGIANFQFEHFLDTETVRLPARDEQREIAATLGALNDKIESNQRAVELAEGLGDAIFLSHVASQIELSRISTITMGSSPPGASYNEISDGVPFYQGTRDFGVRFPERRVWTTEPVRLASVNDTLFSVRAPVGEVNRAREICCVGRGVAAISSATPSALFYALRSSAPIWEPFQGEGTVFGAVNKDDLAKALIPWPSATQLANVEERLGALDGKVESLVEESEKLVKLRDALLPEILNGRIRVPTAPGDRT